MLFEPVSPKQLVERYDLFDKLERTIEQIILYHAAYSVGIDYFTGESL